MRRCISIVLVALTLSATTRTARADTLKTDATLIIVGVALVGVVIGVTVVFLVRRPPAITGCAVSTADGMSLRNEGDSETFSLAGDVSSIQAGERVKVSGKKKKNAAGYRAFFVDKLKKDYGTCKATP